MNLNKIEAHTNSENTQSVRMIEKLGFWLEGVFHNHFYEDDTFHDVSLFALLRRDFVFSSFARRGVTKSTMSGRPRL